jgi:hypothetical protein
MNYWLGIALIAYLIGALIEGINAASQLSDFVPDLPPSMEDQPSETEPPQVAKWQFLAVVLFVSACGACIWPCRLIHRACKGQQEP